MENELPKIREQIGQALEFFVSIARLIHTDASEGYVLDKAIWLADEWLRIETKEAQDAFVAKQRALTSTALVA